MSSKLTGGIEDTVVVKISVVLLCVVVENEVFSFIVEVMRVQRIPVEEHLSALPTETDSNFECLLGVKNSQEQVQVPQVLAQFSFIQKGFFSHSPVIAQKQHN